MFLGSFRLTNSLKIPFLLLKNTIGFVGFSLHNFVNDFVKVCSIDFNNSFLVFVSFFSSFLVLVMVRLLLVFVVVVVVFLVLN